MSNIKLKPKNQETKSNKTSKLEEKGGQLDAQKFFDFIMSAVKEMIQSDIFTMKREIRDLTLKNKILLRRIKDVELDYRSLGIAISSLGLTEINLLNNTSNKIKEKLSVMDSSGGIKGRIDTHRFNLTPSSDKLMGEISNNVEKKEGSLQ